MKHQGEYGFTYDSEAEEWAAWAWSFLEHNPPERNHAWWHLVCMWQAYNIEAAKIARHSPAQPQNTCETGQPTGGQGKIALLWPVSAIVAGAVTIAALFIF